MFADEQDLQRGAMGAAGARGRDRTPFDAGLRPSVTVSQGLEERSTVDDDGSALTGITVS